MKSIILIPSYQPNEVLPLLCKALKECDFKVVVVDDGGGERFQSIFEETKKYADVLGYEKNQGKGFALKYGFKYIYENYKECKSVITADGDGQHRILDIQKVDDYFNKYNCTIIGTRVFDVPIPLRSKVGNDMSKFTQALGTYKYSRDNQCGLRLFKYEDLPLLISIQGNRYEYEMNVLSEIQLKEIKYLCVKVATIYEPENSTSHFRPLMDTLKIQGSILLKSLPALIGSIVLCVISSIFLYIVLPNANITFDLMLSILAGFASCFVVQSALTLLIYKPRNFLVSLLRNFAYTFITSVSFLITSLLFTRLLGLHLIISYLLTIVIFVFPFYFLIKLNTLLKSDIEDK